MILRGPAEYLISLYLNIIVSGLKTASVERQRRSFI
jgi:hypothetical protein